MKRLLTLIAASLTLMLAFGPPSLRAQSASPTYQEIIWDDLLPSKWLSEIKLQMAAIGKLGFLVDGSEEADQAMQRLRSKWDNAPIDQAYIGKPIRIAGYAVTLDANKKQISEFLLVPYFGACIHLPPPPANQTILIKLQKPITKLESMDTVWVQGILRDARVDTGLAVTGYTLESAQTKPYVESKRQSKKGSAAHP
jgi:uncharacterized protein